MTQFTAVYRRNQASPRYKSTYYQGPLTHPRHASQIAPIWRRRLKTALFAVSAARATGPDISQFYIFYMVIYFNI